MSSEDKKTTDQPSTIGAYVDQAIGTVQTAIGNVIGNPTDQKQGEDRKAAAEFEGEASKAAAKVGPFTLSSTGAVAKDSSDRTQGSWDQTVGSAKETVGNLIGNESLKQQGIQQNKEGKAQEAAGQLNDLGSGIADRVTGTVGGAVAGLTGNTADQQKYQAQHDTGKSLQRGVEHDVQKQIDAEDKNKTT